MKDFKVYTKEEVQDYSVVMEMDLPLDEKIVHVGTGGYLAQRYKGEIVVYNNLGAMVAEGSSSILESLNSGMYILQTVEGTYRIVITQ